MEIYELPITVEESRNYHNFLLKLKMLSVVDWVKAYMCAVIFSVISCFACFSFMQDMAVRIFWETGIAWKVISFLVIFLVFALQRSKNVQLRAMLQKYFINNLPQDFLNGRVQLKKIRVQRDKILVYYRKLGESN